ncbi:hypothetical protein HY949_01590 [Candidatus Gottesmanbacteria bacterium]|nr:hypothetical protein [Candidatus Gottesmanbacteria bacterium]
MREVIDKILWGTLIVLFGPTTMIVASWNALPGEPMYGVKIALEKAALTVASPSYASSGTLQIKYTERRYAETKQLLASRQSIEGLPYLQQQIAETKKMIENAPNKASQVALAKQYINTLASVSTDLEAQKQSYVAPRGIASAQRQPSANPPPTQSNPTATPTPIPTATSTPSPLPTTVAGRISTSAVTPTATVTPISKLTSSPTAAATTPAIAMAQQDQKSQISVSAPIPTNQAIVALQINQTQQDVSRTIADLQTIVKNDDKDQKENHRKQKEGQDKKEDKERREKEKKEEREK